MCSEEFPDALCAFCAGSVVRGENTELSDIDLIVISSGKIRPYRKTIVRDDWIIEIFVHTETSIKSRFAQESKSGYPIRMTMICEGVPIIKNKFSEKIKKLSQDAIAKGPATISKNQTDAIRYKITSMILDLPGKNDGEMLGTLSMLFGTAADFYLRINRKWSGYRKYSFKALQTANKNLAIRYRNAFNAAYKKHEFEPLKNVISDVLAPAGGFLIDGFKDFE